MQEDYSLHLHLWYRQFFCTKWGGTNKQNPTCFSPPFFVLYNCQITDEGARLNVTYTADSFGLIKRAAIIHRVTQL